MSIAVSSLFIDSFDSQVKLAYQGSKSLRTTVRVKNGVIGSTHKFDKAGQGVATQHNRGNDVVAMNASRERVSVTLQDWDAFDYVDILDINKLAFDEQKVIAESVSKAIGRREDQLIIDAIEAAILVANTVGTGVAPLSVDLLGQAAALLNAANVPSEERTILLTAIQLQQLLEETEATSSDFNTVKALVKGELDTFYGFKFIMIGTRTEGGLPREAGTQQYAFVYHKQAVGLAIGKDMTTMVDWVAQKTAWLIGSVYSAGAVVIDDEGMVAIDTLD